MARNRSEERQALSSLKAWMHARPSDGVVVGTVKVDGRKGFANVQFAHVDCCPIALVAAAWELLNAASEKLLAAPYASEARGLIADIEKARAALDFQQPESVQ